MTRTALLIFVFLSFYNRSFSQEEKKVWSLENCLLYAEDHNLTITDALLDQAVAEVTYDQSKLQKIPRINGNISQIWTKIRQAGYGYSIFYNHRLLIKQKKIPVIQGNQKFHTKQDAGEVAELVIIKMKNGINPSISYEELANLSITIK
ncbi:MAG: DUF4907 domain-containing protein [Christiangramia sp.]|uniref:DUF4907 domain-containing protein n=1 Tax=Christiangramia sp. TaxID=1931228 RepID=UPI0032427F3D